MKKVLFHDVAFNLSIPRFIDISDANQILISGGLGTSDKIK